MRNCLKSLIVTLAFFFVANTSESQETSAVENIEFSSAVQKWLDGEDLSALQSLSELSMSGHIDAQMLLASIAKRANMFTHITSSMPRHKRIELLRAPGGLSGKSWMAQAAKTEPLARALLQAQEMNVKA